MAKTNLGAPQTLTPDTVVGPTDTPTTTAPASSAWVADVADKSLKKDTDIIALDTATPTDTNKVPNAVDVKEQLDTKLNAKLETPLEKVMVTDAAGNIIPSTDVTPADIEALGALTTDGALVAVDVDGRVSETTLTKDKAEALGALTTEGVMVSVGVDGKVAESDLTLAKAEKLQALTNADRVVKVNALGEVVESGLLYDGVSKRLYQDAAPLDTADNDLHLLTLKDYNEIYEPKTFLGSFVTETNSDTWTTIIDHPDFLVQARSPVTGNRVVLITNKTGNTVIHSWQASRNDSSEIRGNTSSVDDNGFEIVGTDESGGERFIRVATTKNANATNKESNTWWFDIISHRIGTTGYRIYVKMLVA